MEYYVIGPDGAKYGPGDIPTLQQWIAENRIGQQTILEDVATAQRAFASQVSGLTFAPSVANMAPPPVSEAPGPLAGPGPGSPYESPPGYYPRQGVAGDGGKTLIMWSWICSGVGIICCPIILCLVGIVLAVVAATQGSKKYIAPLIFGVCALAFGTVLGILSNNWVQELLRQLQVSPR